jgi:N-acetylmuramoyl-L-alanine amidase
MIKYTVFIQTILICLLPLLVKGFNSSLSFDPAHAGGKVNQDQALPEAPYRIKTIVIDAGHGGKDPGCSGSSSREKHIALAVSLKLAEEIRAKFPDIRVILTRDKDVFIPLHERAAIANRADADLFISIHCNYMPGSSATRGTETYVMGLHTAEHNLNVAKRENSSILLEEDYEKNYDYDPNSPEGHIMLSMFQNAHLEQSILLAERFEAHAAKTAGRKSRGVKQAGFVVLKETAMPSILAEIGFLSSYREERFLKSGPGQDAIVKALVIAFAEYKQIIENDAYHAGKNDPVIASQILDGQAVQLNTTLQNEEPLITIDQPLNESKPRQINQPPVSYPAPQAPQSAPVAQKVVNKPPTSSEPVIIRSAYGDEAEVTPAKASVPPPAPAPTTTGPASQLTRKAVNVPPSNPRTVEKEIPESPRTEVEEEDLLFCVQLAASPKPLNTQHARWADVEYPIEVIREDNYFKYQARSFQNLEEANKGRMRLRHQGFMDAFIVIYRDGERLSPAESRRILEGGR